MGNNQVRPHIGIILAAGSAWGITEFAFGLGLQKCAALYTGAILSGLAFFWIAFIWSITRNILSAIMIMIIAMAFKFLDALLLPVAWNHGSIMNPMFAFLTQAAGFALLVSLFSRKFGKNHLSRILVGGGAAAIAVALFPLVRFATGIPACTYASTSVPLAYFTAPVAIGLSMITVPLGYLAATAYNRSLSRLNGEKSLISRLWSPAVMACCLLILTLSRIL